jgi:hypothetical protein
MSILGMEANASTQLLLLLVRWVEWRREWRLKEDLIKKGKKKYFITIA